MLEKIVKVDRVEVVEDNCVHVRTKTAIMENGEQISGTYHRHVVEPGDDYSKEDKRVRDICKLLHTPEVVAKYQANKESIERFE